MSKTIEFTVRVIVTEEEPPHDPGEKYLVLSIETSPINGTEGPLLEGGNSIRYKDLQQLSEAGDLSDEEFFMIKFRAMSDLRKELEQALGDGLWKYIRAAKGIPELPKKAFENWFSRYEEPLSRPGTEKGKSNPPPAPEHHGD